MIYEYHTKGQHGFDGVTVPAGKLVATIVTEYPLDNILAGIRHSQFTVTKTEPAKLVKPPVQPKPVPPASEPPADKMTTKKPKPSKGEQEDKWSASRTK